MTALEFVHNSALRPIEDVIPHRDPHKFLDGALEYVPGVGAKGFWKPAEREFDGHFPNRPILMGVKQIEALAQLGCYAALYEQVDETEKGVLFVSTNVDFTAPVFPGEIVELSIEIVGADKPGQFKGMGVASVNGGEATTKAEIVGMIDDAPRIDRLMEIAKRRRNR